MEILHFEDLGDIFMSDGKLITDINKTISNKLNNFFTSIGPKLASKIKTKGDVKFTEFMNEVLVKLLFFTKGYTQ